MKNMRFLFISSILISGIMVLAACNQQPKGSQVAEGEDVSVYYFHTNARCVTCLTIEEEAKKDVSELFGNKVVFASYNLDEKEGLEKGKGLGVNSQMLIIVKGEQKINITNEGFLYARTNPEKFRKIIEENIKSLL